MRYSVRYDSKSHRWSVIDTAIANQVVGNHGSKSKAYHQAIVEQERWRKFDPVAQHLARLREAMPRTLVAG